MDFVPSVVSPLFMIQSIANKNKMGERTHLDWNLFGFISSIMYPASRALMYIADDCYILLGYAVVPHDVPWCCSFHTIECLLKVIEIAVKWLAQFQ